MVEMNKIPINRFFTDPCEHYFLFGPRGTGKSTWIKQHHTHCLLIDMLEPDNRRRYTARPERLRETIQANPDKRVIVIDEVEKTPDVLTVVHAIIEEKLGKQFILTGSSARKLKRSGVDLLGGRALVRHMHPFMAAELGNDFQLEKALKVGLLPLILAANNPGDQLKSYITTYLQLEVQAEGLVRNIGDFLRFLEVISFSHGCVLNMSNIARECAIERKTAAGYIVILEDLLLSFQLPVFSKRAKRQLITHNKFYLFDAGVFSALRPSGILDYAEEMQGPALEGLVAQHLQAWIDYANKNCTLYFWRTKNGVEVDFILYGNNEFFAFEIKNSRHVSSVDLKGLKSFKEDYPESQAVMLYRGHERLMIGDILCLPCDLFLKKLHPLHSISDALQ